MLDTDVCIAILREVPAAIERVRGESPADLAIASMTEAELRYGALRSSNPAAGEARIDAFLSAPIAVLPFDRAAAAHYAEVRHALRRTPIGNPDLVIASTALANGLAIITGNGREFRRVRGLEVETVGW
ncbi:MAG TPA: type II toxin-antitoxin system VapC family toxin [Gemmatimonadaceae bacterium]|nr:type II toxin-antitoxin system VapC family toxin [Gemmatimonadaceae bacterium]